MTRHLRALLIVKVVEDSAAALLQITEEDETRYRAQSKKFSQERLIRMMNSLMTADSELRYASSPRIGLEIAMLKACREETGEDTAALAERVGELEIKISELPKTVSHPSPEATPALMEPEPMQQPIKPEISFPIKPAEPEIAQGTEQPAEEPASESALDDQEIWKTTLKTLTVDEKPLAGMLKSERYLGVRNGVFRVQVTQKNKVSFMKLKTQSTIDVIAKALSVAAGKPVSFEAVLEGTAAQKADINESIQTLANTVGRDLLQIDETET